MIYAFPDSELGSVSDLPVVMAVGDFGLANRHPIAFLATLTLAFNKMQAASILPWPPLPRATLPLSVPSPLPRPLPRPLLLCNGPWLRADRSGRVLVGGICFKKNVRDMIDTC
jgi:hypothetical protein